MFGFSRYNYDRFRREMLDGEPASRWGQAPTSGDDAPDFNLRSLDGDDVCLSEFRGSRNVVVTFGSATCPQTAASIGGLRELAREFPQLAFLFVYVREAHPGSMLPPHRSLEDKARAALILREQEQIKFPVLIDELSGETHRRYGALANASFLVDLSGRVAYRSLASHTPSLGAAIEELLERQKETGVQHAIVHGGEDTHTPSLKTFLNAFRAIERGGHDAVVNFRGELGLPGRMVLRGGRLAQPITEHPALSIAVAVGVVGALGLGIWAGYELRRRRLDRLPYDAYRKLARRSDEDDYSLGI